METKKRKRTDEYKVVLYFTREQREKVKEIAQTFGLKEGQYCKMIVFKEINGKN